MAKKRYAVVGTGGRSVTYIDGLAGAHRETTELVAFCDPSPTRMAFHNKRVGEKLNHPPVPTYLGKDFDRMVAEKKPDTIVVTTMDSVHDEIIVRAMELGCDVICEKPMTTDAKKARAIFDAIQRTGRKLRITHNCRYLQSAIKIRELLSQGVIGKVTAVDLCWTLDTSHGADYFRRWHAEKDKSGGLLIHKSSHHFDMVNWWVGSQPKTVYAIGETKFYGKKAAKERGEEYSYTRYTGNEEAAKNDPFKLALDTPGLKGLYRDAEAETGYIRDKNVFGDHVTAEDTVAITCRYRNGVIFNYSLIAYSPWEGWRLNITGTKGRIEYESRGGSHIIAGQDNEELAAEQSVGKSHTLRVCPMFGKQYEVPIQKAAGSHGGSDSAMMNDLFATTQRPDPLGQCATHIDGAAAVLLGIAANESMATGQPVDCDKLVDLSKAAPGSA